MDPVVGSDDLTESPFDEATPYYNEGSPAWHSDEKGSIVAMRSFNGGSATVGNGAVLIEAYQWTDATHMRRLVESVLRQRGPKTRVLVYAPTALSRHAWARMYRTKALSDSVIELLL